jgi:type II secretory pathway predicted ATPase ExeA
MYLSHFKLQEKPFKVSTDPKFLWLGEKHKEALETLRYGILNGDGYVVLTGDVGTGKTMLAMALAQDLSDKVIVARLPYPDVEVLDFLKLISAAYGINSDVQSKASFRDRFESFLRSRFTAGKRAVLILDEAQRMRHEHLEELLQLSSTEENGVGLLNIVFVGQNEFNEILQEDSNRGLRQRIVINYNLVPLTRAETEQYISHRLNVVHCKDEIFTPEAIQEIFLYSNGIPRLINIICDLALLMTYLEAGQVVQPQAVRRGVERLRLPGERPELIAKGDVHSPVSGIEISHEPPAPTESEVQQEVIPQDSRKKARSRLLWAGGLALAALLIGLALLSGRQGQHPGDRKVETPNEQRSGEGSPSQAEMKSPKEQQATGATAVPLSEEPLLTRTDEGSEPSAQKKAATGSEQPVVPKKAVIQSPRAKSQKGVDSKVSAAPPRKAPAEPPRDTRALPEKETDLNGSRSRSPLPTTGSSPSEPVTRETEEAEPGRAIDWLLEKRERK